MTFISLMSRSKKNQGDWCEAPFFFLLIQDYMNVVISLYKLQCASPRNP